MASVRRDSDLNAPPGATGFCCAPARAWHLFGRTYLPSTDSASAWATDRARHERFLGGRCRSRLVKGPVIRSVIVDTRRPARTHRTHRSIAYVAEQWLLAAAATCADTSSAAAAAATRTLAAATALMAAATTAVAAAAAAAVACTAATAPVKCCSTLAKRVAGVSVAAAANASTKP